MADTGPLYAAASPRDQYHGRARAETARLAGEGQTVVVLSSTLCECHSLVLRRLGLPAARTWLTGTTLGAVVVDPSPQDRTGAVDLLTAYPDQPLTLFDALVAVVAERLGLPVWTYDHHFDVMRVPVWR